MKTSSVNNMKYLVKYPENYKKGEKYPVLLFLHGAGSRGKDINLVVTNPFFEEINKLDDFPFVVVAPQCHEDNWFDLFPSLKALVEKILNSSFADKKRLYMMGASMGGYAAWQLSQSIPEAFAAIVPICGGGMYWNAERVKNIPAWAFHGSEDVIVFPEESKKMVEAIKKVGGEAHLTIYEGVNHNAWSATYRNPEVYKWLLSKENQNIKTEESCIKGSKIFG